MNVQRFTGKNAREAMAKVRALLGESAVVVSNRAIPGGVEILAIPGSDIPSESGASGRRGAEGVAPRKRVEPMSTLSFENYVRERQRLSSGGPTQADPPASAAGRHTPAVDNERRKAGDTAMDSKGNPVSERVLDELRSMRDTITAQLSSLSWFDSVRRNPVQTQLLRLMLSNGFSPALSRYLVDRLPQDRQGEEDAAQWLSGVIAHNLHCVPGNQSVLGTGGVYALVGPTGVGKTTTTAKLAAAFAMQHGPASIGLITVDNYRMAASDQLRAFGRLLNIPVHTASDAASLMDLLELFQQKALVLIDTVGASQRDSRVVEQFELLPADKVTRLLVLNAGAQAETLDEVAEAYGQGPGTRCIISKLDEAVRVGGVVDVAIRRQMVVQGVANGQRVPEDWHPARSDLLAQKSLLRRAASVFSSDETDVGLMMTAPNLLQAHTRGARPGAHG